MGKEGAFLLEPQYDGVHVRCDRPALVYVLRKSGSWTRKWGVVTSDGRVAATTTFSDIRHPESPHHDLILLCGDKRWGLVNVRTLTTAIPISYDRIDVWGRDLYAAWSGKHVGLVTAAGEWRLPVAAMVDSLPSSLRNNHGPIHAKSGIGLISGDGEIALPCRYEDVGSISEGLVPAKQGGRWGYVNLDGKWIVPPRYEEAGAFLNGFAAVRQDGRVGLIDKRSKVRVPFRYADAGYVLNDRFPFADEKDGKRLWGVADLAGNTILPSEYDCVEWIDLEPGTTRYHGKPGWSEF